MSRRNPWDRQPDETNPAWEAFRAYRDMGGERSLSKVAEKLGKSQTLMGRWSGEHAWVLRVNAWDAEQDRELQAELRATRREAARRNAELGKALKAVVGHAVAKIARTDQALRPQDLPRLVDAAVRLEQSAFDLLVIHARAAGDGIDGLEDLDLDALSDEEIRGHMVALRRELDAELADYPAVLDGDPSTDCESPEI